jgi:hypothetical protein
MPNSIFMPICPKDIFDVKAAGEEARAEDLKKIPAEFFFERPAFEITPSESVLLSALSPGNG